MTKQLLVLTIASLLLLPTAFAAKKPSRRTAPALTGTQAKKIISRRSWAAWRALDAGRLSSFAAYVHPTQGVRFSPSLTPGASERVLSRAQVRGLSKDTKIYNWGLRGDTPQPVHMTWKSYVNNYVFYTPNPNPPDERVFTATSGPYTGIAPLKFYPANALFVQYSCVGSSLEQGHDWYDLWFIWQKHGATWYLTGIAHDREDNGLLWKE